MARRSRVGGGLAFGVAYVLDGATHNNPYDNLNLPLPFPDALQEFGAETSALTAKNGMHSGAAVNAVTKSGSNQYRGDVFEFFRHHSLNATDPFAAKDADGNRKDDGLKRNQYGAHARRTDQDQQGVLLRRLSGDQYACPPDRQPRVRSHGGDAGRRLHRVRLAGLQRRRAAHPGGALRREHDQPGAVQQGGAEHHQQAADHHRSLRPCSVWPAGRAGRRTVRRQGRLSGEQQALVLWPLHRDHPVQRRRLSAWMPRSRTCS